MKTVQKVNQHNAAYNHGESTYQEVVNQWADMTEEEFVRKMTGIKMPNELT